MSRLTHAQKDELIDELRATIIKRGRALDSLTIRLAEARGTIDALKLRLERAAPVEVAEIPMTPAIRRLFGMETTP